MMLLGQKIGRSDFIPPIVRKLLKREKGYDAYRPFVHEILSSYGQYHEDLVLDILFSCKNEGFYIDVGANDPEELSNTKRFYEKGWSGINIEPTPHLYEKLCVSRKRDINLNVGIAPERGEMPFYIMSADTLSSFDKEAALKSGKIHGAKLLDDISIQVLPLNEIFDLHVRGRCVDILSVDVEGFDLDVLKSNDWERNRPYALIVEINQDESNILQYLEGQDYLLVYNNFTNGVFIDNRAGFQS